MAPSGGPPGRASRLSGIRQRSDRERPDGETIAVAANDNPLERAEVCAIVHEEIDRLGDAQRLPILLCALEGLSHEEAAQRLKWPVGTVKSRLVRGRRRLEGRLARRGLAPAVVLAAGLGATPAMATPVPLALAVATTRGALQGTAVTAAFTGPVSVSISSPISVLLQKELSAIFLAKVALAASVALAACTVVVVIGLTLAGLPGRGAQGTLPLSRKAGMGEAIAPTVPSPPITSVPKTDRGIPERQPAIPGGEKRSPIVEVPKRRLSAFGEQVEHAIDGGIQFLKAQQRSDGSWADIEPEARTGMTSLVTLALLTAGETADSQAIRKALDYLRHFGPAELRSTYAISLQTMVFATAEPERNLLRIVANVRWLELAQIKPKEPVFWPGSWAYSDTKRRPGDNSNSQYALLGLLAASEVGVPVNPSVWELSRSYWERAQKRDGGWAYTPDMNNPTASMTCAGVSSVIISRLGRSQGQEFLQGEAVNDCGKGAVDRNLQAGIDWLASRFQVGENFGGGQQWKFYYLHGLERAGRLAGIRFFGTHDWYRAGAEELVRAQDKLGGYWLGKLVEENKVLATSFALLFLAKGRAPVLINKLRYGPSEDWNNDPNDVRNIVSIVSRDWQQLLTWQLVELQKGDGLRPAPGADPLYQRTQCPGVHNHRKEKPARVRRARRVHTGRSLLSQCRFRPGLQEVDRGVVSREAG